MAQQIDDNAKAPTIEPALQSLGQLYTFRRPEEVFGFLQAHPFLVPLLVEACGKIAEYFGPSPEIILEVVTDPEAENDRELFALVRTGLSPDEALSRLGRLDQEWWLDASSQGCCLLNIFKHNFKPGLVTISGKLSDDVPPGTLNNIWKQAKLGGRL